MAWNAELYQDKHAFVFGYGRGVLDLLEPMPGERVIDLGCGTGQLTMEIARRGVEHVFGIDASPSMIQQASLNYPVVEASNYSWRVADAASFEMDQPVDAIFSNATLHWVQPPKKAIERMRASLRRGGRLVAEFGGYGNIDTIAHALESELMKRDIRFVNPWFYPSIGTYTAMLESNDFVVRSAQLFPRPTPLAEGERGMRNWIDQFATAFFAEVANEIREDIIESAIERVRPRLWNGEHWTADYVRLRIVAIRL